MTQTLLCELTDHCAKNNYFAAFGTYKEKEIPTIFGHQLYIFLFEFLSQDNNKVNFIEIIKPKDVKFEAIFYEVIKNYSPDIKDYTSVWEIEDWFPEESQLGNNNLRLQITNMIRRIKFVDPKSLKDENYLCYLRFSAEKSNNLLLSEKYNFTIVTNTSIAKLYPEKIVELDYAQFKEISQKLTMLKKKSQTIFDENLGEARCYKAPKYLDNFENGYFEEIQRTQFNTNDKELYFFGSESHSAHEGINYLFGPNNYREYNLSQTLEKLPIEERAFVFLNFHQLFNQNKQNDLAERLQDTRLKNYKVIQGNNIHLISYFEKYRKVNVPEEIEIKNSISGIFISVLRSEGKYKDRERDWTLYPLVKHKLLNSLLDKSTSPKAISLAVNNFSEITKTDLIENVSFWCLFFREYSEAFSQINKNKVEPPIQIKDEWILEIREKEYRVIYPHEDTGPLKYLQFLTYLMLLIKYTEIKNKPLSVDLLRKAIIKYDGKKLSDEIDPETARIAVSKIFNKAKKDNEWFETFYNSYIKYENYEYGIDLSSLKLSIIGFELKSDFFKNL